MLELSPISPVVPLMAFSSLKPASRAIVSMDNRSIKEVEGHVTYQIDRFASFCKQKKSIESLEKYCRRLMYST